MVEHRLTAAEAANAIVGLINSRPASPWPHEIEAIVAGVAPLPNAPSTLPEHVTAYRTVAQGYYLHAKHVLGPVHCDAPDHDPEYLKSTELSRLTDVAGDVVLKAPAETWGDLVGLASIVAHEEGHDLDATASARLDQDDCDPGQVAAEKLALAVLRLHARTIPQLVPVDFELVRLISEWRCQRDIVDRTALDAEGCSFEESEPSEEIIGKASSVASNLAKQIWERAKAETWSGGPVNPLTLAVLAEIVLHHENGASNTLVDTGEYYMDQKATTELMVAVLSYARSAGVASDLLPMEGRFLPPALLKGGK